MKFIKKIPKDILIVFVISLFTIIPNFANLCRIYLRIDFDSQAFINWQYASSLGLLPYKEIYYPYGILFYFKNSDDLAALIYLLIAPLLFISFYLFIKHISKDKVLSFVSVLILILFVIMYPGLEVFTRYGTLLLFSQILSYVFVNKFKKKLYFFFFGFFTGTYLSIFNDLGIYAIIIFLIFSFYAFFNESKKIKLISVYIKNLIIFFLGLILGFTPFLIFAVKMKFLSEFVFFLKSLGENILFAKTPFFHSILTPENFFITLILIISLCVIIFRLFNTRIKTASSYFLAAGLICLVLLEQKSIVRQMDIQITFIALYLFLILLIELKRYFPTRLSQKYFYLFFTLILLSLFIPGFRFADENVKQFGLMDLKRNLILSDNKICISQNHRIPLGINEVSEDAKEIKETIKNEDAFFYPDDKIYYSLLKSRPYYYPSIYESSYEAAQDKTINQLINRKNEYIVYNMKNRAIQDEVPNYLRASLLHNYILRNYQYEKIIGDQLILRKGKRSMLVDINKYPSDFREYLLNINLGNIPSSEGENKQQYIFKNGKILFEGNISKINKYLLENNTKSHDIYLVLQSSNSTSPKEELTLATRENNKTNISFNSCKEYCIINLSKIPLFSRSEELLSLNSGEDFYIYMISLRDDKVLW